MNIIEPQQMEILRDLAVKAAIEAGDYAASFSQHTLQRQHKQAGSSEASQIVTEIDIACEAIIYAWLKSTLVEYDLAWLAEESAQTTNINDHARLHKNAFWCVDPLDGTLPFVEGRSGYSVSIALVNKSGVPLIGVVYDPVNRTLYSAALGQGVSISNEMSDNLGVGKLTLCVDRSFLSVVNFPKLKTMLTELAIEKGLHSLQVVSGAGAVINAMTVFTTPDCLYLKLPKNNPGGGSLWDFAATTCLFTECDKPVSDISGNRLNLNQRESLFMNRSGVLFSNDRVLHEQVIHIAKNL